MFNNSRSLFNPLLFTFIPVWIGFAIFDVILKGVALWKAAKNHQKVWFVALLIVNSLGILPAIYILFFQKNLNKRKK
ncbi:MAG TPA: DUF5652 family protein [Candidatus Saccharimonadales bacterium]|nr:DUF5652 family protein [Candidatus Saccharimonadales bacterium]